MDKTTAATPNLAAATGSGTPASMVSGALAAAAVAVALTWAGSSVHAAALGAVTVQSALGEPLRAEIQIPQLSSEEASTFSARMASPSAFAGAGISYNTDLSGAVVSVQRRANGEAYLRITTDRPINEPVLGIVIEADWASGQVTRDYTMLLDPPRRTEPQAANPSTSAPAPVPARTRVAATPAPQAPRVGQAQQVRPAPAAAAAATTQKKSISADAGGAPQPANGSVTVRRGDTASQIAVAHGLRGVSLDQMLMAMLRTNPNAFIRNNVNLVRAGAVIQMPSAADARTVSRADARRMVLAQTEDFQAYRRGLAQNVQATQATPGSQSAEGQVEPQVADAQKPPAEADRLEVSKGGTDAKAAAEAAQTRQSQDQTERVAELDRNISELSDLERQLTGDSAVHANADAAPTTAAQAEPATQSDSEDSAAGTEAAVEEAAAPVTAEAAAADADAADSGSTDADAAGAEDHAADEDAGTAAPDAEAEPDDAAQPEVESAPTPAAEPAPSADASDSGSGLAVPASLPAEQPGNLLDQIAEYRWPIIAILVALLALLGIGRSRRRKREETPPDLSPAPSDQPPAKTATKAGGATAFGSDDADETRLMTPAPDTTPSTAPDVDSEEISEEALTSAFVDTAFPLTATEAGTDNDLVKEADIYVEYGHDEKAEPLLEQVLQSEPGRTEIYEKLARIYQRRNDAEALAALAARAAAAPSQAEAAWQAVAAVGREMNPDSPRYAVSPASKTPDAQAPLQESGEPGEYADPTEAAPRASLDAPFDHQMFWAETKKSDTEFQSDDAEAGANAYGPTTLDFDLSFEETGLRTPKAPTDRALDLPNVDLQESGEAQEAIEPMPGTHEESLDLDIDFSISEMGDTLADDADASDAASESVDHSTLMEFDLGTEPGTERPAAQDSALADFNLDVEPTPTKQAAGDSALMDFDLGAGAADASKPAAESTLMDFDLGAEGEDASKPAAKSTLMDFDLGAEGEDASKPAAESTLMDFDLGAPITGADEDAAADDSDGPLATKLALAKEFEAIGDREGARSMAREVAEAATGALKEKAEAFLGELDAAQ